MDKTVKRLEDISIEGKKYSPQEIKEFLKESEEIARRALARMGEYRPIKKPSLLSRLYNKIFYRN